MELEGGELRKKTENFIKLGKTVHKYCWLLLGGFPSSFSGQIAKFSKSRVPQIKPSLFVYWELVPGAPFKKNNRPLVKQLNDGWATLIVPKVGGGYLGTIRHLEAL